MQDRRIRTAVVVAIRGKAFLQSLKDWWPAVGCAGMYCIVIAGALIYSMGQNEGLLVYPLDDTYIHMAIAKSFVQHGVWGLTRHEFTSTTSSPLYTGLLAAAFLLSPGTHELAPLALNAMLGIAVIFYMYILMRRELPKWISFVALLFAAFVTSLLALTLLGMEHLLHLLLILAFVDCASRVFSNPSSQRHRGLLVISSLLPLARYEGLFAIAFVVAVLVLQKRLKLALVLMLTGCLPVFLYGLICHLNGWLFVPNSVWIKGDKPGFTSLASLVSALGGRAVHQILNHRVLLLVFLAASLVCLKPRKLPGIQDSQWWSGTILIAILFAHGQAAQTGWLYRYEAYLVGVGLVIVLPWSASSFMRYLGSTRPLAVSRLPLLIPLLAIGIFTVPFVSRGWAAISATSWSMHVRYLGQIQTARFLKEYFPRSTVALNDIGAVAYFGDNRLLDLLGLASMEPVRFRMGPTGYTSEQVEQWALTEGAEIAVVQIEWEDVRPLLPDSWVKVAEWKHPKDVFEFQRIAWFAVNPEMASELAAKLREFQDTLPKEVEVSFVQAEISSAAMSSAPFSSADWSADPLVAPAIFHGVM